jgi:hypothetical protein
MWSPVMDKVIALPSVQSLFLEFRVADLPIATGTGFIVIARSRQFLFTNRHNVTGRRQDNGQPLSPNGAIPSHVRILHNVKSRLGEWTWRQESLYIGEEPRWKEHPMLGARADFVALPLTSVDNIEVYAYDPVNPGPDLAIGPSETVSVVGFPFGLQGGGSLAIWATGFVASEPDIDFRDLPQFLIDCRARPGQSGSAVIAHRTGGAVAMRDGGTSIGAGPSTRLLGIYSGRVNSESDLGIVWKTTSLRELVESL